MNNDDGELSLNADTTVASNVTITGNATASDPLDLASLAEFEDEAALINELLASATATADESLDSDTLLPALDVKLARLLGTLEHACQDTSAQVERAIDEVSRSVPRLTFDLQLMRENVVLLRYTLDSIRKRSAEAISAHETSSVMRRLKVLDTVKTRMEASRDVLREAEAWSSLESEVTALVQEQSYVKAAERLAEANKSMVVFQNSPEYEQRRNLMVSLQNGLEAGLSASLVAAIAARDIQACRNHHAIFAQIQRETEFRNYYFGSRRAHLVKDWQNANLSDCSSSTTASSPAQSFAAYLPTFFASLQNTVNDERTYIPAIFSDPVETLSAFLQTTLDSLSPSFPQRISDLSNSHGPRLLFQLIEVYHATEECAVAISRTFSGLQASLAVATASSPALSPATPGGTATVSPNGTPARVPQTPGMPPSTSSKQRARRQSKTLSISRRHSRAGTSVFAAAGQARGSADSTSGLEEGSGARAAEAILGWETTLFEPFLDWQAEYADLESRLLKAEVTRVTSGNGGSDTMAFLLGSSLASSSTQDDEDDDGLDASAASGLGRAKEASKLLLDQTSAVIGLAEDALGRCMALTHGYGAAGYVEAVDDSMRSFFIRECDTLLRAKDSRIRTRRDEMLRSARSSSAGHGQGEVEHHLDYSSSDLAGFQIALRLLEACRSIGKRIDQLESRTSTRLVDVARLLREARQEPLNQLVPGTTRGALALLWQSTLNSAALSTLLESVERAQQAKGGHVQLGLFRQARASYGEIARAAQLLLHEAILLPLMCTLEGYTALPAWTQPSASTRPEARGAFDLHIPTFSLSPSEIITRIGEGFLNLPAMFEMYADDEALGYSLDTLSDLEEEMVRSLRREAHPESAAPLPSPHAHGQQHGKHTSRMSIVGGNEFLPANTASTMPDTPSRPPRVSPTLSMHATPNPLSAVFPAHSAAIAQAQPWSTETVISAWLSSLTRAVLLHLANVVIPSISCLSKHGIEQLASDLGYISNVAKALDVEVEQVEKWRVALDAEAKKNTKAKLPVDAEGEDAEEPPVEVDQEVADMLRRMRINAMGRPSLQSR